MADNRFYLPIIISDKQNGRNLTKTEQLLLNRGCKIDFSYGGCDVGDGWLPIVERIVTRLFYLGWDGEVHQVKEKFGVMRFYIGKYDKKFDVVFNEELAKSRVTCEDCGTPGVLRQLSWIKCLCDAHYADELDRLKKEEEDYKAWKKRRDND